MGGVGGSGCAGRFVTAPSARSCCCGAGTRGSAPQDTRRSCSPPKPVWRDASACQAVAGSGAAGSSEYRSGSSSRKIGPVSSTDAGAGAGVGAGAGAGVTPAGAARGSPSDGAGRLVPGTHAAPFQYRTYPGMDGSG
ncbi:hypothetical protein ACFQ0Q_17010 [Streptomyces aureus]